MAKKIIHKDYKLTLNRNFSKFLKTLNVKKVGKRNLKSINSKESEEMASLIAETFFNFWQKNTDLKPIFPIFEGIYFVNAHDGGQLNLSGFENLFYKAFEKEFNKLQGAFRNKLNFSNFTKQINVYASFKKCTFEMININSSNKININCEFENCIIDNIKITSYPLSQVIQHSLRQRGNNIVFSSCEIKEIHIHRNSEGSVYTRLSIINNSKVKYIDFSGSEFIYEVIFLQSVLGVKSDPAALNFSGSAYGGKLLFDGVIFESVPAFQNSNVHHHTDFVNCKFEDYSAIAHKNFQNLKYHFQSFGDHYKAMYFHSKELEARSVSILPAPNLLGKEADSLEALLLLFLKGLSSYNRDMRKSLIWLFIVFIIWSCFYYLMSGLVIYNEGEDIPLWLEAAKDSDLRKALWFSLKQTLGPLSLLLDMKFITAKTGIIKLISMLQFILSTILWFLLIVQVRARFRL